jgi:hypothetical protein
VINLNRDQLTEILRLENDARLSHEGLLDFDVVKHESVDVHIRHDEGFIIKALIIYGFNPSVDDSLKAYHLATTEYINDPEVREQVVWMKYDKCKVGDFRVGGRMDFGSLNYMGPTADATL